MKNIVLLFVASLVVSCSTDMKVLLTREGVLITDAEDSNPKVKINSKPEVRTESYEVSDSVKAINERLTEEEIAQKAIDQAVE